MDVDALLDDALEGKPITDEKLAQTLNGKEGKEVNEEKEKERERSRSRSRSRDRKKRRRSSSRDRKRSSSRDRRRKRSRSRDRRRSRSRSRDRRRRRSRSRSRDRRRSRSRDRPRVIDHRRSPPRGRSPPPRGRLPGPERRDVMPFTARQSPPKNAKMDMSAEERDFRTIFVLQIARQTRPRDLEEFFSSVGHVRDVRIITDSRTGRSKGIAYVEFWEEESVALGLALNGQRLLGAPLVIQRTCAERNRAAAASATVGASLGFGPANNKGGPVKLHISNLHPNIDEKMLESLFEGFGKVTSIKMNKDNAGNSLGIAYVTFQKSDDGHKAAEQLNGFDLAGNALNIRVIDDEAETARNRGLDNVVEEKAGVVSGQAGRVQMMQRLAQGSNMEVPEVRDPSIPSIATQCFMLSNMFDPSKETEPGWDEDVKQDVLEECTRHGGAVHIYVDKSSAQGNVYVKCSNVSAAHKSVTALHGRWFSGKVITANYVPVNSYHELFPDSMNMVHPLQGRSGPPIPPPPAGFGYPAPAMGMSGGYSYY